MYITVQLIVRIDVVNNLFEKITKIIRRLMSSLVEEHSICLENIQKNYKIAKDEDDPLLLSKAITLVQYNEVRSETIQDIMSRMVDIMEEEGLEVVSIDTLVNIFNFKDQDELFKNMQKADWQEKLDKKIKDIVEGKEAQDE